ncbi:OCIA domain-containing protein 1-like isoform X2 [Ptychodera flava]|uniref:OCIA domain-containing protein 1-like isoform X2 n=1 Tax=Ptychodera flava TaxID=63121 RepID=UPI00396A9832
MAESAQDIRGPPVRNIPGPGGPGQQTLTEAEKRVLKECTNESTWFRAIPLGGVGAGLAYYLVKLGKLTASPKYGAVPKMAYAAFFGYIIGKISYLNVCRAKIMALENSPMAEAMRKKMRPIPMREDSMHRDEMPEYSSVGAARFQQRDIGDIAMSSPDTYTSMDIDPTKQVEARQDDTVSAFAPLSPPEDDTKKTVTYDELRKKHRSEQRHMVSPGYVPPPSHAPRSSTGMPTQPVSPSEQDRQRHFGQKFNPDAHFGKSVSRGQTVNKYGDVVDDIE